MNKLDALLIISLIGFFAGTFLDNEKAFYTFMIIFSMTAGYWIAREDKSPASTGRRR
jgi:hypothetical protein